MEEKLKKEIEEHMKRQYERGLYTAANALSVVIRQMIEDVERRPKKRLADYISLVARIKKLCSTKLTNPYQEEESV